jgi:hypothetical protein
MTDTAEPRYYDQKGVPIYPGDLLKSFHFRDRRRRRYYLYHVAVLRDGYLMAVPVSELEPTKANRGGTCHVKYIARHEQVEVIYGAGPGDCLDYTDRPKGWRPFPAEVA